MSFKDWIHRYYGMLVNDFLDSDLSKQISFSDLANAFSAGNAAEYCQAYAIVSSEGLAATDELEPEDIMLAHEEKVIIIDMPNKSYYLPGEGWVSLMEGELNEGQKVMPKRKDKNTEVN